MEGAETARPSEPFDFSGWDQAQFRRAGNVLSNIAQRKSGLTKMKDMIMSLYFPDDLNDVEGDEGLL